MSLISSSLINVIKDQFPLSHDGLHGVDHWVRVLANGKRLAERTGALISVVELFSLFHDARRFNEGYDPEHGIRGAAFAMELRGNWFDVSDHEMNLFVNACELHSTGEIDADVTIQTCWDADRLDLGRVGIVPDPRYLCTNAAKDRELLKWAHERAKRNSR